MWTYSLKDRDDSTISATCKIIPNNLYTVATGTRNVISICNW